MYSTKVNVTTGAQGESERLVLYRMQQETSVYVYKILMSKLRKEADWKSNCKWEENIKTDI
jgi:hypothetical protein